MEKSHFYRHLQHPPILEEYFLTGEEFFGRTDAVERGYEYWRARFAERGRIPARSDIDITQVRSLVPNTMLIDVKRTDAGCRFRFRLMGEQHVDIIGGNYTGKFFDEVDSMTSDSGLVAECYEEIVRRAVPHYWMRTFIDPNKDWRVYEHILLPLSTDGQTVEMLLAFAAPVEDSQGLPDPLLPPCG